MKKSKKIHRFLADSLYFIIGSAIFGVAVSVFTAPHEISLGGVTGVAVVVHYLTKFPIGIFTILLNIPLMILAYRYVGRAYFVRTLAGLLLSSLLVDAASTWIPPYLGDSLLSAVFGGVLAGLGLGLIHRRGGSTGGVEIGAALLRKKWPYLSIGSLILWIDGGVILLSAVVFGSVDSALYAIVAVFLSTQVMDMIINGNLTAKVALIISPKSDEIADAIFKQVDRGVTKIPAVGGYSGNAGKMLLCAVGRTEGYRLRQVVRDIDPTAFMVFTTAEEICGNGFEIE